MLPLEFCKYSRVQKRIHCVRGQSGFFNLALTEGNMQIKFDLKLSVYSSGVDIWLLSFEFNFGPVGWPPQPPRERVLKINKIEGFWWSISHWEAKIGLFGAMVNGNIKLSNLFCEMRLLRSLRPLRLLRLLRSLRPQTFQDLENHYWALQSHPGYWIKLYFDILKTIIFGEIMKYHSSFFAPFLLEAVEARLCYFCKNWF